MLRTTLIIFLLLNIRAYSQTPGTSALLTVNDGLSQGMVTNILQSSDGYMWFATKDGLNRFDGYRFEVYSNNPFDPFSIGSNEVHQMFEDSRGWLWISYQSGVDVLDPGKTGRFFHLVLPQKEGDFPANHFCELPEGGLVCQADSSILWRIRPKPELIEKAWSKGNASLAFPTQVFTPPPTQGSVPAKLPTIYSVFSTKSKKLLATTADHLYQVEPESGRFQPLLTTEATLAITGEDRTGRLWLQNLTYAAIKLWYWQEGLTRPQQVDSKLSNYIGADAVFDPDGTLWLRSRSQLQKWEPTALAGGGKPVFEINIEDPVAKNRDFFVASMSVDRSGLIWLGTNGFGVLKVRIGRPKFESFLAGTSQRAIIEDPEGYFFTALDEFKTLYPSKRFDSSVANPWAAGFDKPVPGNNLAVFDQAGNCWISNSANTLYRVDASTKATKKFPWQGFGLAYDPKSNKLFAIRKEGMVAFDPATEKSKVYPFDQPLPAVGNDYFNHIYADSQGEVWIFYDQLIRATPTGTGYRYQYFNSNPADTASLSKYPLFCVMEDPLEPQRYLWVGTKGGGMNRLDRQTGKFRHFTKEEGLPDNVVYGILTQNPPRGAGGGYLWLSTNKGLCRFDAKDFSVKNFTYADGLQSNEFNSASFLKTKDGTLIFGGVNGVTVFHPDSLRFNENLPQTQVVGIQVNNRKIEFVKSENGKPGAKSPSFYQISTALSHRQNLINFDLAALEFSNPAQNLYRYQLVQHGLFGDDDGDNWISLGQKNSVQFANLRPGSYTFRVLGSNNDGIWGQQPAEVHFTIRPPWWATWWAYLLYATFIISLLTYIRYYEIRRKLVAAEALRLHELDEFKNRFFTNITHEFRTPLTVILGTSEQLASGSEQWAVPQERPAVKSKLGLIKRNGESLLRLINQLLDLAKLESNTLKINYVQGDVLPYLRYIAESLHSLANAQNVMLRVESREREIIMDYDPERLLQIVYNLLSNAIKFTPSGGRVVLFAGMRDEERGMRSTGSSLIPHPSSLNSSLILTVSDTGTGIPPEDLPYIFDRFYQANNLEKAKAGGTGIGLALTRELVLAMQGEISVESEVGKGTIFTVNLPITNRSEMREVRSELVDIGEMREMRSAPSSPLTPHFSLLIIEDNPDVVEYLTACLQNHYALDFAYNGRAGIEKALETVPDLIVSDVMMPEKDGYEVCEALKNNELTSHIPIVLLTAKAGVENRIAGLKRGADAYLSKPFHQEELHVTLANLLEVRKKLQAKYSSTEFTASPLISHPSSLIPDPEDAFLQKVKSTIAERLSDSSFTVDDLSRALAMSQRQLHRKLTALTNRNASAFLRSMRLAKAKELLLAKEKNVSEVAYEVGFDDPKYFSRVFTEEFGVPPSKI